MPRNLMAAVLCIVAVAGAADQRPVPTHARPAAPKTTTKAAALTDAQLEAARPWADHIPPIHA